MIRQQKSIKMGKKRLRKTKKRKRVRKMVRKKNRERYKERERGGGGINRDKYKEWGWSNTVDQYICHASSTGDLVICN